MQKENKAPGTIENYVGPYRLEKTLGKGQTGKSTNKKSRLLIFNHLIFIKTYGNWSSSSLIYSSTLPPPPTPPPLTWFHFIHCLTLILALLFFFLHTFVQ